MKQIVDFVKNDKRILITGIIILFLIIIGTILAFTVGSSTAYTLENELREMGKDFYENFFYDEFNSSESEREEFLAKYGTIGFKVNLSNLVRTNKKVNEVNEILFMLEVDNFIKNIGAGKYVINER